jgi:hypothetical protein
MTFESLLSTYFIYESPRKGRNYYKWNPEIQQMELEKQVTVVQPQQGIKR